MQSVCSNKTGSFYFQNIITPEDKFTFTICTFHASQDEATKVHCEINNLESQSAATKTTKPF
jgi:23S rRNA (adenine1618-N6)-methyltransferase